jgi:hypothetical protein
MDIHAWVWKKWIFDYKKKQFTKSSHDESSHVDIDWITNPQLKSYIERYSMLNPANGDLPNEKGHLYWAVLEENSSLQNTSICRTSKEWYKRKMDRWGNITL